MRSQLLFFSLLSVVGAWKCGIGPFSGTISYILALPADAPGINGCCVEHDALIEGLHVAREEADRVFCHCLTSHDNWYVRTIVKPLFCTTVELYTKWFDTEKTKERITHNVNGGYRFNRY